MICIRYEKPEDIPSVHSINERAFGQAAEADIVDKLRRNCRESLSLVAEDEGHIVGHILFTPTIVETGVKSIRGMGLAPMAVLPERQRESIGSMLVEHGLSILQDRSCPFVIVLGHTRYYLRFGFEIASKYGLVSQWDGVPAEAFMVLIFDEIAMKRVYGIVKYRNEFEDIM